MCGVGGYALNKRHRGSFPVRKFSERLLLELESRGTDATGFIAVMNGTKAKPELAKLQYHRSASKASEFIKGYKINPLAHTALLHTRHMTKGDPKLLENNHPLNLNTCYVIHNGKIENDDALIKELGYEEARKGEVDSFAIPCALEGTGWGDVADIKESLKSLQGYMAIAAIDPFKKPGKILLAKGENSPLAALVTPHGVFWASTSEALKNAWGDVLGTPPKEIVHVAGKPGIYHFTEGDFWILDTLGETVKITPGRFDVTKMTSAGSRGVSHLSGGTSRGDVRYGNAYSRDERDFTCWPDSKRCVFCDDCSDCNYDTCECYEGNPKHPRLNSDETFLKMINKWPAFKSHCERLHLDESLLMRSKTNPTKGSNSEAQSKDKPWKIGSRIVTVPSSICEIGKPSTELVEAKVNCYYCNALHGLNDMRVVTAAVVGTDIAYECKSCQNLTINKGTPIGHKKTLDKRIKEYTNSAVAQNTCVEVAIQETAWEFGVEASFVKLVVFYCPVKKDDPKDWNDFIGTIKRAFIVNLDIKRELKQMRGM